MSTFNRMPPLSTDNDSVSTITSTRVLPKPITNPSATPLLKPLFFGCAHTSNSHTLLRPSSPRAEITSQCIAYFCNPNPTRLVYSCNKRDPALTWEKVFSPGGIYNISHLAQTLPADAGSKVSRRLSPRVSPNPDSRRRRKRRQPWPWSWPKDTQSE